MFLFFMPFVSADGGVWYPGPNPHEPQLLDENSQYAAINYQNGLEKMIISINIEDPEINDAVWIFPIPSDPEEAAIDIVGEFPALHGQDVMNNAERELNDIFRTVRATQIYPLFFGARTVYYSAMSAGIGKQAMGLDEASNFGITVHEHIEKKGMAAELISASDGSQLYEYLSWKRFDIAEGSIPVLENYVGQDYCFVVAWIESGNEFRENNQNNYYRDNRQIGVQLIFPVEDEIFYPLLPTSVYGSKAIPIDIYMLGHVTPNIYSDIESFSKVDYYVDNYVNIPQELEPFFGTRDSSNMKYTKLEIRGAPSKFLTQDLRIKDEVPSSVSYAQSISDYSFPITILMILFLSFVSATVAGIVMFNKDMKEWKDSLKYGLIGLANIFSLVGFIIVTGMIKTKDLGKLKKRIREEGLLVISSDKRKVYFIILFTAIFMVLSYLVAYLMKIPLN